MSMNSVVSPVADSLPSVKTRKSKPNIVFLGMPQALKLAYSAKSRSCISRLGSLSETELTQQNWMHFPDVTREADVILSTWGMPRMDAKFLEAFPQLRAVFYAAGAVKQFVTDASYDRPVAVSSAAVANAIPVAEYTISTILLSLKRFWLLARDASHPLAWPDRLDLAPGTYHSTVGLISLGAVGRTVVDLLSRFDMDLIAYDPYLTEERAEELGVEKVSLEELFRRSDVVSLHAPLIRETENLVNARLLRMLKTGATFINTSRGAIVNELELCHVLRERPDITAVLDVTSCEPTPLDSPLRQFKNIILTPHIAGSLGTEISRMGDWMVEELKRYLSQKPLRYQVTRDQLDHMA